MAVVDALRVAMTRFAVALAAAQIVGVILAGVVDAETIPAALLATLALVPAIAATVWLEARHRMVLARVAYVGWLAVLLGVMWWWAEGDPIFEMLRGALLPFWLFTGVSAWGILRRGWPLLRRSS